MLVSSRQFWAAVRLIVRGLGYLMLIIFLLAEWSVSPAMGVGAVIVAAALLALWVKYLRTPHMLYEVLDGPTPFAPKWTQNRRPSRDRVPDAQGSSEISQSASPASLP